MGKRIKFLIDGGVACAPLAGFTDYPFRMILSEFKPGLMFCEMVKVESLVRKIPKNSQLLAFHETMRPIGAQLCGSSPKDIEVAVKIIEDMGFDVIDLNCGCPTDRITKDGSGSGLLRNPNLIGEIVSKMVNKTSLPVTVKIRVGWDGESINVAQVSRIVKNSGASALFVHGRTRAQGFSGASKASHIKEAKDSVGDFILFGNGDIFSPDSAKNLLEKTNCNGVLLARGLLGAPWLIKNVRNALRGDKERVEENFLLRKNYFLKHLSLVDDFYKIENKFLTEAKKLCGWYLKNHPDVRILRKQLAESTSRLEVLRLLNSF